LRHEIFRLNLNSREKLNLMILPNITAMCEGNLLKCMTDEVIVRMDLL